MPSEFIDYNAPSLQGGLDRRPEDLPHGLITPPERVRELIAREKARFPPKVFTPETEERLLNEWTLDYYFDYLGHEVIYRRTPQGPVVLAVGYEEVIALKKSMPLDEQLQLKTRLD